ncbi:MAG: SHOCT domain-containing protein [Gammaproteobacteria bacterium]|nr:SHOCT domain-containing protein [Gammaproteobacteria bacterium]
MWWIDGFGWGWMIFGGLMMVLFWGGLIALVVLAVQTVSGSRHSADKVGSSTSTPTTALNILKERYARGEISKAEYEEMRPDIAV